MQEIIELLENGMTEEESKLVGADKYSELQKMKGMMGAVIAGAKQMTVWDGQNGTWDVPRPMQMYESMVY